MCWSFSLPSLCCPQSVFAWILRVTILHTPSDVTCEWVGSDVLFEQQHYSRCTVGFCSLSSTHSLAVTVHVSISGTLSSFSTPVQLCSAITHRSSLQYNLYQFWHIGFPLDMTITRERHFICSFVQLYSTFDVWHVLHSIVRYFFRKEPVPSSSVIFAVFLCFHECKSRSQYNRLFLDN